MHQMAIGDGANTTCRRRVDMERYTFRDNSGMVGYRGYKTESVVLHRLADYEDSGCTPEQVAELAEAEREGRIIASTININMDLQSAIDALGKASKIGYEMWSSANKSLAKTMEIMGITITVGGRRIQLSDFPPKEADQ